MPWRSRLTGLPRGTRYTRLLYRQTIEQHESLGYCLLVPRPADPRNGCSGKVRPLTRWRIFAAVCVINESRAFDCPGLLLDDVCGVLCVQGPEESVILRNGRSGQRRACACNWPAFDAPNARCTLSTPQTGQSHGQATGRIVSKPVVQRWSRL